MGGGDRDGVEKKMWRECWRGEGNGGIRELEGGEVWIREMCRMRE